MSTQSQKSKNYENKDTLPDGRLSYQSRVENYTTCQYEGCEEEGHIYQDKLVPVRLCDKHRNARHGGKK